MKHTILLAFILLLAIFAASLFGDNIKSYVVKDVMGKEMCELNGEICKCYSKECVCGDKIIPKQECLNRVLA